MLLPFLAPVAEAADVVGDFLTQNPAQNMTFDTALGLFEGVIRHMKATNPSFKATFESNETAMRDLISSSIRAYLRDQSSLQTHNYFGADIEERVKQVKDSGSAIDFVIDRKTALGVAIATVVSILAALLGVIVSLPQSQNFYRDLKMACTQVTVGVLKAVIDITIASLTDVLAIVSSILLFLPKLLGAEEFINKMPVLRKMNQLATRRMRSYENTFEDFAKFGLMIKLRVLGMDVKNMTQEDKFRLIEMMDRMVKHQATDPNFNASMNEALESCLNSEDQERLIEVLHRNKDYLPHLGEDALEQLGTWLSSFPLNAKQEQEQQQLAEKISAISHLVGLAKK